MNYELLLELTLDLNIFFSYKYALAIFLLPGHLSWGLGLRPVYEMKWLFFCVHWWKVYIQG